MQAIQEHLESLVASGAPGAFVYIEESNGLKLFRTAGFADLATRRGMKPEDRYRVGSTTKTFTAVVVLQLVAEGALALNQTARDLLPDLPVPRAGALTVEHLLRMRSGLFDFEDDPSLLGSLDAHLRPLSLAAAIHLGITHPPLFGPGTRFSYCNTNFCLLEAIIERITGHALGEEFRRRIFAPLDLARTAYPAEDDLTLREPYIRGYDRTAAGWRECSQVFFGRGDGALISTAVDLARFFRALLIEGALLPAALLARMMEIVPDNPPAEGLYGLGLLADPLPCGMVWGHAGGGFGYEDFPYLRLDTGRFGVLMLNGTSGYRQTTETSRADRRRAIHEIRDLIYC